MRVNGSHLQKGISESSLHGAPLGLIAGTRASGEAFQAHPNYFVNERIVEEEGELGELWMITK